MKKSRKPPEQPAEETQSKEGGEVVNGKGFGTIHPCRTLMMTVEVGTAEDPDDTSRKYTMLTSMGQNPIIRSSKTGKWYVLGWQDILQLAVANGIDEEDGAEAQFALPDKA